jgi:hypothetical protein
MALQVGDAKGHGEAVDDADLRIVFASWSALSDGVKRVIVALVESNRG